MTLVPPVYVVDLSHADADVQLPPDVGFDPAAEVVVEMNGGVTTTLLEAGGAMLLMESDGMLLEAEEV